MQIQKAVAMRLCNLLMIKKMTRYALCKKMAMSESTLYNIINEKCKSINLSTLYLIAEGLDLTVQEFMDDPLFDRRNLDIE